MANYRLVGCDTDSIKFCHEDGSPMSQDEMDSILDRMNAIVPEGIILEPDGYYEHFLVIKSKNYVTVKNGKTEYKGSAVTDQKKEPALREMLEKMIMALIYSGENMADGANVAHIYTEYCLEALTLTDIKRWAVKKTVTEAVMKSERANETKVLEACKSAIKAGYIAGIQEGDKIWVYNALSEPIQVFKPDGTPKVCRKKQPVYERESVLKFTEEFDPDNPDHDPWHYVKRCYDTVKILKNVYDIDSLPKYHLKSNRTQLEEILESRKE